MPEAGQVSIVVYDIMGRPLRGFINSAMKAGTYEAKLNLGNFSSGVYFCRIEFSSEVNFKMIGKVIKVQLLK